MMEEIIDRCPYCNQKLSKWMPPKESDLPQVIHLVCFNDECRYYIEGWQWMRQQYNRNISYRFKYVPSTGEKGPLPVWSNTALRSGIIE